MGVDVTGEMPVHDGFVSVEVADRTVVELELDMSVKYMRANTAIRHDAGRLAVMRGPVVYCAESCDNRAPLWDYRIGDSAGEDIACAAGTGVLEGLQTVSVPALRTPDDASDAPLYMPADHGAQPSRPYASRDDSVPRVGEPRCFANAGLVHGAVLIC